MGTSRWTIRMNVLAATLLVAANAQAPGDTVPVSSTAVAFLSPNPAGSDQSCSGANPEGYCSIEQQFTQNQPPPSATYNPNDLAPTQMSQLLGALQPSQNGALSTPTQSDSSSSSSPENSSAASVTSTLTSGSLTSVSTTSSTAATSTAPGSTSASSSPTTITQQRSSASAASQLSTLPSTGSPTTATITSLSSSFPSASNMATGIIPSTSSSGESASKTVYSGSKAGGGSSAVASTKINVASVPSGLGLTASASASYALTSGLNSGSKIGNGSTASYLPVILGTNGVLIAGSSTLPVASFGPAPSGLVRSGQPVLGSYTGVPPPYAVPTGMLPPGHQSPTGVLSYNGSSNSSGKNSMNVLPFTGHGTSVWGLTGGWRCVTGAGTAILVFACSFL